MSDAALDLTHSVSFNDLLDDNNPIALPVPPPLKFVSYNMHGFNQGVVMLDDFFNSGTDIINL